MKKTSKKMKVLLLAGYLALAAVLCAGVSLGGVFSGMPIGSSYAR